MALAAVVEQRLCTLLLRRLNDEDGNEKEWVNEVRA